MFLATVIALRTSCRNNRDSTDRGQLSIKLRSEEELMLEQFPEEYSTYQRRVKRLIPFILDNAGGCQK